MQSNAHYYRQFGGPAAEALLEGAKHRLYIIITSECVPCQLTSLFRWKACNADTQLERSEILAAQAFEGKNVSRPF